MQNQYAHMVGSICLDKAILPEYELEMNNGKGQPITFEIWKVFNGSFFPGHNNRDKRLACDLGTVADAQKEICRLFEMEMNERGYEFRIEGEATGFYLDEKGKPGLFEGETGWYDLNNPSEGADYPESDYPSDSADWIKKQITGYNYDNYSVVITTSNRDIVSL